MSHPASIGDLTAHALEAYESLVSLGEDVEDEWSYVNDLASAWRERLDEVQASRGGEPTTDAITVAAERLVEEVARISDPHRAIDWLSTFPQVFLVALGEEP